MNKTLSTQLATALLLISCGCQGPIDLEDSVETTTDSFVSRPRRLSVSDNSLPQTSQSSCSQSAWAPDLEIEPEPDPEPMRDTRKPFTRGDVNEDGMVDVSDAQYLFSYLFQGGVDIACSDSADVNDDGMIDISDPSYLLAFLFRGGPAPAAPFLSPGFDPTEDNFSCDYRCPAGHADLRGDASLCVPTIDAEECNHLTLGFYNETLGKWCGQIKSRQRFTPRKTFGAPYFWPSINAGYCSSPPVSGSSMLDTSDYCRSRKPSSSETSQVLHLSVSTCRRRCAYRMNGGWHLTSSSKHFIEKITCQYARHAWIEDSYPATCLPDWEYDAGSNSCTPPDRDGDGVADIDDACPYDADDFMDSDEDGTCDNADAFPQDPSENRDSDNDGVGDNGDACPDDSNDTVDSDGDGTCDNADAFPQDPSESRDYDGDGIGDNTDVFPTDPNDPSQLAETVQFISLSAGPYHTCGVSTAGEVHCWGRNQHGQSSPPPGTFSSVSVNYDDSCGVMTSGEVQCWGYNHQGSLYPPADLFASVSAGSYHNCGITTAGELRCWGRDFSGQSSPPAGIFESLSLGQHHGCAVKANGEIACWGSDGAGYSAGRLSPPDDSYVSIGAGLQHSCAVTISGAVRCWGRDKEAQSSPPAGNFVSVSSAFTSSCGLTEQGEVQCWGATSNVGSPGPAALSGQITSLSVAWNHSCAISTAGRLVCWMSEAQSANRGCWWQGSSGCD